MAPRSPWHEAVHLSHFPRVWPIIENHFSETVTSPLYIACVRVHTRGGALHQSASLCVSGGREISKSKIVQLVSSGVSAAYVANVRHRGTKRDEEKKRAACRSNRSAGAGARGRERKGEGGDRARPAAVASEEWRMKGTKKREGSKKQKEGGGMRGSRRRSCRRWKITHPATTFREHLLYIPWLSTSSDGGAHLSRTTDSQHR